MWFDRFAAPDDENPRPPWLPPTEPVRASSPASWPLLGEPWESLDEAYDGAVALYDLERAPLSGGGTTRVVARFVAVRFCRIATAGRQPPANLRAERAAAELHTARLQAPPAEARALRAIVQLARAEPPRRLLEFLHEAAILARTTLDRWGAFALHREAYRLAVRRGWHEEAARAAGAIALLAQEGGGRRSPCLWRLRARRHLRRTGPTEARRAP